MNNMYEVFNVKSDLQLNSILNKLDLTPYEMVELDEITSGYGSTKDKRKAILEMMASSSENNYKLCEKYFSQPSNMRKLKEDVGTTEMVTPSHLNMNQAIQLNSLFELASKKFQEVNCSQAFYQMLSQKLSKNFANAFFNTLKSSDETSELKYNPELSVDGKNFAETIFPLVNELTNFLNGCKSEKKEEVKESALTDTLNNLKYHISVTNNENNLKELKKQVSKLFNMAESTEDRNVIAEILSLINTKLSSVKPTVNECCDIDTLLEPFKTTVVNITVNDNGDFVDCEKETAKQSLKALASHVNDTKDCCQENNIENMETISSLLSSLARYFHKRICESLDSKLEDAVSSVEAAIDDFGSYDDEWVRSLCRDAAEETGVDYRKIYYIVSNHKWSALDNDDEYKELDESYNEKYNNIRVELNDIKQEYLNNELDVYDATNAVDNLIGNKSEAEAIVDSWDDPSKHGLYGIDEEKNNDDYQRGFEDGQADYESGHPVPYEERNMGTYSEDESEEYWKGYDDGYDSAKGDPYGYDDEDIELDEDTVYDHSWYEVKGQKYPKRTKNGVEIKEDFKSMAKKAGRKIHKGLDKIHNATVKAGQKMGLGYNDEQLYEYFNEYLVFVFMIIYGLTTLENTSFEKYFKMINGTDWNMENVHRFVMKVLKDDRMMSIADKEPERVATYMKYQLTHMGIDRKLIDKAWKTFEDEELNRLDEMCSGGACCAGAVATIPSPVKPKSSKKKKKKSKVSEMAMMMFKRHIIEGIDCQLDADGNHYEYKDGYFYINGDIAKTTSKYYILESLDGEVELETLKGFNSQEMRLLEDIEAQNNTGNEDEQNSSNDNNNTSNSVSNPQSGSTSNSNVNQNNLGDVQQNVTQDNDLTPEQRQLKKDTEGVLDNKMKSGTDIDVTVNQGTDNNNQTQNPQISSNQNIKYKLVGKDDSDPNNIKYIIQDPTSKETQIVDATKLRLEK